MIDSQAKSQRQRLAQRVVRGAWRWCLRVLGTCAVLLGLIGSILAGLQLSSPGRALVLEFTLKQVNALIPGTINARRLDQLSLLGLEVWGLVVLDPKGHEVIRLEHALVTTDVWGLAQGIIALEQVRLEEGSVDLRTSGENQGLIAAFVDSSSPESPPSTALPPDIAIEKFEAHTVRSTLPEQGTLGLMDLYLDQAEAHFSLIRGEPELEILQLKLRVKRQEDTLLALEGSGHMPQGRAATTVRLRADSGPTSLLLEARLLLPTHDNWQSEPAKLSVDLRGVTAEQVAHLLKDPTLEQLFLGEMDLKLDASGTTQNLNVEGALVSAAGTVQIRELRIKENQIRALLSTDRIALNQLRADFPDHAIGLDITAEATGLPPDPTDLRLSLREATLDGAPLFDLDSKGTWTGNVLKNLQFAANSNDSRVNLSGNLELNGESKINAQIDLRPELVARLSALLGVAARGRLQSNATLVRLGNGHLAVEGSLAADRWSYGAPTPADRATELVSLEHLDARYAIRGIPPSLQIEFQSQLNGLARGELYIDKSQLSAAGTLAALSLKMSTQGGWGALPSEGTRKPEHSYDFSVAAQVERRERDTRINARGGGHVQGRRVELDLEPTTFSPAGNVETRGLHVKLDGQGLDAVGALGPSPNPSGLHLHIGPIQLAEVPFPDSVPALVGKLEADVDVTGTTTVPQLKLTATGSNLGMKDRPLLSFGAEMQFDAALGQAGCKVKFSHPTQLAGTIDGAWNFAGGTRFLQFLRQGSGELLVNLEHFGSAFIEPYLPAGTLPFDANLRAKLKLSGSIDDPQVHLQSNVSLDPKGAQPMVLTQELEYQRAHLDSKLTVSDTHGPFAALRAQLHLPSDATPSATELPDLLRHAAAESEWNLHLTTQKRSIASIPLLQYFTDVEPLPPLLARLSFDMTHARGQEPLATLNVEAEQGQSAVSGSCAIENLKLKLNAKHRDNQNHLELTVSEGDRQLLLLHSEADLALAPFLVGQAPKVGPLNVNVRTEGLDIGSLPLVCGQVTGKLKADLVGEDLLSETPRVEAEIATKGLRLAGGEAIDLDLLLEASSNQISSDLKLRGLGPHQKAWGHLTAQLPISFRAGHIALAKDAALNAQVELSRFPINPLLPPKGPISYARGTLDSKIEIKGTLQAPLLHGKLVLNQLSFTSTAVAQPLREVNGMLQFNDRKISLLDFEAHDQEGVLKLSGELDLGNMNQIKSSLDINAKNFPLRQRGQVVARTSVVARAESTVSPQASDARITFRDVDTWLETVTPRSGIDLAHNDDFIVVEPRGLDPTDPSKDRQQGAPLVSSHPPKTSAGVAPDDSAAQAQSIDITIEANERFWVKRDDFAVKLSTLLHVHIAEDEVSIKGEVSIDRGYLQLFGKVFDLKRESAIRFIGGSPPNPVLEIEAEHRTRNGTLVAVRITGRGDAPVLTFFVEGTEVDAGVAVQELFGGEKNSDPSGAGAQAQSFVSGLTAGLLATAARRELGGAAPIIMVDPSEKAGEGRVRAGFELDDLVPGFLKPVVRGMYLEGVVARDSAGGSAPTTQFGALLELYFPKNLFTAGQYGPGTTWSIDFGWQL